MMLWALVLSTSYWVYSIYWVYVLWLTDNLLFDCMKVVWMFWMCTLLIYAWSRARKFLRSLIDVTRLTFTIIPLVRFRSYTCGKALIGVKWEKNLLLTFFTGFYYFPNKYSVEPLQDSIMFPNMVLYWVHKS